MMGDNCSIIQPFYRYLYSGMTEEFRELEIDQLFQLYLLADQFQASFRFFKKLPSVNPPFWGGY